MSDHSSSSEYQYWQQAGVGSEVSSHPQPTSSYMNSQAYSHTSWNVYGPATNTTHPLYHKNDLPLTIPSFPGQVWPFNPPSVTPISSFDGESQISSQFPLHTVRENVDGNIYHGGGGDAHNNTSFHNNIPPTTPNSFQHIRTMPLSSTKNRRIAINPNAGSAENEYPNLPMSEDISNSHASPPSSRAKSRRTTKRSEAGDQCQHCKCYFKALRRHIESMHPETLPNPPRLYNCPEKNCPRKGRKGFRKDNLTQHRRNVHGLSIPKRQRGGDSISGD